MKIRILKRKTDSQSVKHISSGWDQQHWLLGSRAGEGTILCSGEEVWRGEGWGHFLRVGRKRTGRKWVKQYKKALKANFIPFAVLPNTLMKANPCHNPKYHLALEHLLGSLESAIDQTKGPYHPLRACHVIFGSLDDQITYSFHLNLPVETVFDVFHNILHFPTI